MMHLGLRFESSQHYTDRGVFVAVLPLYLHGIHVRPYPLKEVLEADERTKDWFVHARTSPLGLRIHCKLGTDRAIVDQALVRVLRQFAEQVLDASDGQGLDDLEPDPRFMPFNDHVIRAVPDRTTASSRQFTLELPPDVRHIGFELDLSKDPPTAVVRCW